MNSFAFHELRVNSFLTALPHARHITQICLPSCYISYWRLLTECWRRWRRAHMPRPSSRTTFCFSLAVFRPGGAEQHGVESPPSLAAIYPSSCTWLQTSFGAQGRTCRQYCHVLMTGTETQIALLFVYYNITERAVIHYFYFWIISFTRDLMNKSTVLPTGEHFPSCWSLCGSKATNQPTNSDSFETDVMTINSGMVPHS